MKHCLFNFSLLLYGLNASSQAFINYHRFNSPLPDNSVRTIAIDAQGRKWFGTDYGLAVFNDTTWTVYTTLNSGSVTIQ
jgi:ligand-binding sensor domain-containing protein